MVGANPTLDTDKKRVTGSLMDGATDTGVKIEIRIGGPAIAFEAVTSTMYKDQSILLGYVANDDAVNSYAQFPTKAIVAPLNKNPQIIMWDPEKYPDVKVIADAAPLAAREAYAAAWPVTAAPLSSPSWLRSIISSRLATSTRLRPRALAQ